MFDQSKRSAILELYRQGHTIHRIARDLGASRVTVRRIIKSGTAEVPKIERSSKAETYRVQIIDLCSRCRGNLVHLHEQLVAQGAQLSYPALTHFVRRERIGENHSAARDTQSHATESIAAAKEWLAQITYGYRPVKLLTPEFKDRSALSTLVDIVRNGTLRERKKAATILAKEHGIPNTIIANILHSSRHTTRRYFKVYTEAGATALFSRSKPTRFGTPGKDAEKTNRILELLHCRPDSIGFSRTSWTQHDLIQAYKARHNDNISRSTLARLIKRAGYGWRKASRVLTSPDPNYREKLELLVKTLRSLSASEMLFFIDEWGPLQVRKRSGHAYRERNDVPRIPRRQVSRGTVSLVAALSATTNQVTWIFVSSKDTRSMMDLLEILYNQHHGQSGLYITWDAVSWHNSAILTEWLDDFNEENRREPSGPIIELVPLPTSAQFLNVIEGVLSGMTRAVIHNSDYKCAEDMKFAISRHFNQRNRRFQDHPKRAGNKVWEMDFFQDLDVLGAGDHLE